MKPSKKKEILSFTYKNHWYRVLLVRTTRPVLDRPSMAPRNNAVR